ncbi:hypothetical protein ASG90_12720 [Nocardioides sp. Soil797]|nr:hypothetical protein ASG90_12720 [Nocardioides sp. Soil797]
MRPSILAVVPVLFVLSSTSCSSGDDSGKADADKHPTSQSPDPGDSGGVSGGDEVRTATAYGEEFPYCADLWVEGKTVPDDYAGCWNEDEESVELTSSVDCSDGGKLVSGDYGYGLRGEAVHPTPEGLDRQSSEYRALYDVCID